MIHDESRRLLHLRGAARKARKRTLEARVKILHVSLYDGGPCGENVRIRRDRDAALQELHDAGELPTCRKCGREIGWNGLTNGCYLPSGAQECNDCRSAERERELRGE